MKKLFAAIFLSLMIMGVYAQSMTLQNNEQEDSTIAVVGYFCKNDTMEYERSQGKIKIMGNDTTVQGAITERFMIVVTDSTSEGYKMELIPVSCEVEEGDNDYQSRMVSLIWDDYKNLRCRFTTDEYGSVQHIENWREIRDVLKKSYVKVFDNLYSSMPQLDSIMPRKQFESLMLLGSSTEDGIKEQYSELERLFGLHGREFTMKLVESDDVSEAGYPTHTWIESYYPAQEDEYDIEGDYVIDARTDTQMSGDDVKDLTNTTMGMFFSNEMTDSVSKYINEAFSDKKEGLIVTNREQYGYFFNGWPKLMKKTVEMNFGDLLRRIEFDIIEWTSRHWK